MAADSCCGGRSWSSRQALATAVVIGNDAGVAVYARSCGRQVGTDARISAHRQYNVIQCWWWVGTTVPRSKTSVHMEALQSSCVRESASYNTHAEQATSTQQWQNGNTGPACHTHAWVATKAQNAEEQWHNASLDC